MYLDLRSDFQGIKQFKGTMQGWGRLARTTAPYAGAAGSAHNLGLWVIFLEGEWEESNLRDSERV